MRFQDLVEHEVGHVVDLTHSSNFKNFSGDFLAKIVQNTHFDTRLPAPEGKSGAPCLAAFSISAGRAFVNLLNQVVQRAHLGDFEPQPRVKVGFLSNLTQYFCRKIAALSHAQFCGMLAAHTNLKMQNVAQKVQLQR